MSQNQRVPEAGLERRLSGVGIEVVDSHYSDPVPIENSLHDKYNVHYALPQDGMIPSVSPPRPNTRSFSILSLSIIAMLVAVAAILGGVLGSQVSRLVGDVQQCEASLSPSSPLSAAPTSTGATSISSVTPTSSSSTPPSTDGATSDTFVQEGAVFGRNDCPDADNQNLTVGAINFIRICDLTYPGNTPAFNGGNVRDYSALVVGSMAECITYCVKFNSLVKDTNDISCRAVEYWSNITAGLVGSNDQNGNCWIKSDRPSLRSESKGSQVAHIIDGSGD